MNPAKQKLLAGLGITALAVGLVLGLRPQPVLVEVTTAKYSAMRTTILEEGNTPKTQPVCHILPSGRTIAAHTSSPRR